LINNLERNYIDTRIGVAQELQLSKTPKLRFVHVVRSCPAQLTFSDFGQLMGVLSAQTLYLLSDIFDGHFSAASIHIAPDDF
jgi:hypothetical protein